MSHRFSRIWRHTSLTAFSFRTPYHLKLSNMTTQAANASTEPTHTQVTPTPIPSFYMRRLPERVIGYETTEGKELFKHGLLGGTLESFFPLSQQFLTQDEPAYCGIGTLCMILNAFKIDPAVTWKKPWRWFTQDMLDCCRPLQYVKEHGTTLEEFSCLAKCNGLEATTKHANEISLDEFERAVIASTSSSDQFMAVSYSRSSLGQTGTGHFSPVGGYSSMNGGMVLILDVARFKYPSYWVPVKVLYEALKPVDPVTGQPRGCSILRRRPCLSAESGTLFRLNATKSTWSKLFRPICSSASGATSFESLTSTVLASLTGYTRPVVGRAGLVKDAESLKPSSDSSAAAMGRSVVDSGTKAEYLQFLEGFRDLMKGHCALYRVVEADDKLEITVFLMALYGMDGFLRHLRDDLRREVETSLARDMEMVEIRREVVAVRRQMTSLDSCCSAESDGGSKESSCACHVDRST